MSYLICLQRSPRSPICCCSFGEIRTVLITSVNGVGDSYSGNSSGRAWAARKHEEPGSSVALVRVFLTPGEGPVRRASRREDRRRASAGGPRTFRPGRAGTATRSVRPVRVRGTPVFTQSYPGQQGIHKLPPFIKQVGLSGVVVGYRQNAVRFILTVTTASW